MPIGKNAIQRVENNGYSNVATSAPDMENSTVVAKKSAAKPSAKKDSPVKEEIAIASVKKPKAQKKPAPEKTAKKPVDKANDGFQRFGFGADLPYWLL